MPDEALIGWSIAVQPHSSKPGGIEEFNRGTPGIEYSGHQGHKQQLNGSVARIQKIRAPIHWIEDSGPGQVAEFVPPAPIQDQLQQAVTALMLQLRQQGQ